MRKPLLYTQNRHNLVFSVGISPCAYPFFQRATTGGCPYIKNRNLCRWAVYQKTVGAKNFSPLQTGRLFFGKSLILGIWVFLMIAGCGLNPQPAPSSGPQPDSAGLPAVQVSETEHEFEAVPDGTVVSHDFVIQNTGSSDLILSRISAG
jgi:hypothetical protein